MTAASFFRPRYGAAAVKGTIFDNPIWIGSWTLLWLVRAYYPIIECLIEKLIRNSTFR